MILDQDRAIRTHFDVVFENEAKSHAGEQREIYLWWTKIQTLPCPILTLLPTPEQDDELLKLPLNGDEGGGEMK